MRTKIRIHVHRYGMDTSFNAFLFHRSPLVLVREVSDLFDRDAYNDLFRREISKLLQQPLGEQDIRDLLALKDFDVVGYIDRAVRRAGFRDPDLDPLVHDLFVRLFVSGKAITGWKPGTPLIARVKLSIANGIKTLGKKSAKLRRRSHDLPEDLPEDKHDLPAGTDEQIERFRKYLHDTHGPFPLRVFDMRLHGEDVKTLLSQGISSYRVKSTVAAIKAAAKSFAMNDPSFALMVDRAFAKEQATLAKRFRKASA